MQYAYLTLGEAASESTWVRVGRAKRNHRAGEVYLHMRRQFNTEAIERRHRAANRHRAAIAAFFARYEEAS